MSLSARYGAAALEKACREVASVAPGMRNHVLNAQCYGIGQLVGADLLTYDDAERAFLAAAADNGMTRHEALPTIRSGLRGGMKSPRQVDKTSSALAPKQPPKSRDPDTARYAAKLYQEAQPIAGTVVERYLCEARGLELPELPQNIRCHPGVKNTGDQRSYPAMVAPILNTAATSPRVEAVHVTWIDPDTARKTGTPAKKMYGACKGGGIWLSEYATHMLIAEGIEKTLACMTASGIPGVVGLSSTLLPSIVWPRATKRVTFCADPNGAGEIAINRAAAAWSADGIEIYVCYPPDPGRDWDECRREDVAKAILGARVWRSASASENKQAAAAAIVASLSETAEAKDFERDDNGKLLKNEHNISLALDCSGVDISFDEFACEYRIKGLEGYGQDLSDDAVDELYLLLQREYHFKPAFEDYRRVIRSIGRRKKYHPVRDYLAGLEWDGVERIDEWLPAYAGAPDTELIRAQGRIMLIAAVRRVRQPGCKFDEMIVLESPEGRNKSSALRLLAGNDAWFTDDPPLHAGPRETIERLRGCWIVECAELKGVRSIEIEQLKAFLSRAIDSATLKFERETTKFARQCIFVGSTNETSYLFNSTGNRRFWPIPIAFFDLENLARDRDQLWAEAAYREAKGESIRLDASLWDQAREQQSIREEKDEWFTLIAEWLEKEARDTRTILHPEGPRLTVAEVAKAALSIDPLHLDGVRQKRIVRCMRQCDWVPTQKSNGRRYWSPKAGC